MRAAVCHYSYNRTWSSEKWSCLDLAQAVKGLGVEGMDFHAELLGDHLGAGKRIREALTGTGLVLSALALSNDFNKEDAAEHRGQIDTTLAWLRVAGELHAPVARIFGGYVHDRGDTRSAAAGFQRIVDALGVVVKEAADHGVVLALENHGGLPCTGEEQVKIIETIGSPWLRATIDVGNYMQCGQEGPAGTAAAAPYAAYVHFKDYRRASSGKLEACTVGKGDVDHEKCLHALSAAGYKGFVALEYEGTDDERQGVEESAAFMKKVMGRLAEPKT